ncbi:hypothetical protein [Burkholderia gladioli]|uniref:hypothetical protein n=1 Tax=Burkholderia gladioli TaxID=28095 RepID=UPI001641A943|nr:hypothetical protein [Burkholderia gladioli]
MTERAIDPAIPFNELAHCDEAADLLDQMICGAIQMQVALSDRDMASGLLRALAEHFHTFPHEVRVILGSHAATLMLRDTTDKERAGLRTDILSLMH